MSEGEYNVKLKKRKKLGPYMPIPDDTDPSKFKFTTGEDVNGTTYVYYGSVDHDGRPHGVGIQMDCLDMYEGQFSNGQRNGKQRLIIYDSGYAEGPYKNDKQHGY